MIQYTWYSFTFPMLEAIQSVGPKILSDFVAICSVGLIPDAGLFCSRKVTEDPRTYYVVIPEEHHILFNVFFARYSATEISGPPHKKDVAWLAGGGSELLGQ